jgi:hypothetical protein
MSRKRQLTDQLVVLPIVGEMAKEREQGRPLSDDGWYMRDSDIG